MFGVSNRWIVANDSTDYRGLKCKDLDNDDMRVTVTGTPRAGNGIDAALIETLKHDH
jgi:hypothetical protein